MSNLPAATVTLQVHDIAFGGSGVARHDGKVYFIPFTAPGERISARVVRQKKKFAEAELVSIELPAPTRVEPPCPYFGRCGGCAYQHLTYEEQLSIKARQVEQTLRRLGHLAEVPMRPIVAAPQPYAYRNRIRVHAQGGLIGFFARESHELIDIEQCPISTPAVNEALAEIRASAVPEGDYVLSGSGRGAYFEQTNDAVAQLLLAQVRASVRRDQALLIDAYCGAGFFAKALADLFTHVVGIEENGYAVERARRTATERERYLAGDVALFLGEELALQPAERTTVVLDPPAAGLSNRVLDLLVGGRPSEILYISCNPATLARDLEGLGRGGYRVREVTPFDMFPQTAEIEVLVCLYI